MAISRAVSRVCFCSSGVGRWAAAGMQRSEPRAAIVKRRRMRSFSTGEYIFRDPSEQDRTVYHSGECLYAVHGSAGLGELGSPGQAEAYPTWGMLQLACRATARLVAIIQSPKVNP